MVYERIEVTGIVSVGNCGELSLCVMEKTQTLFMLKDRP